MRFNGRWEEFQSPAMPNHGNSRTAEDSTTCVASVTGACGVSSEAPSTNVLLGVSPGPRPAGHPTILSPTGLTSETHR
ncbi:hypothetical protein PLICRDRAFT_40575 [Plicaturopsis crispa FD-325 SS-3]|nr:hypothetical protein PLICRDRAFT_40575 [Plicaturopsis crispa FD-325 SS-3]